MNSRLTVSSETKRLISVKHFLGVMSIVFCLAGQTIASPKDNPVYDTTVTSTQQQAIEFINKIKELKPSVYWPNI